MFINQRTMCTLLPCSTVVFILIWCVLLTNNYHGGTRWRICSRPTIIGYQKTGACVMHSGTNSCWYSIQGRLTDALDLKQSHFCEISCIYFTFFSADAMSHETFVADFCCCDLLSVTSFTTKDWMLIGQDCCTFLHNGIVRRWIPVVIWHVIT